MKKTTILLSFLMLFVAFEGHSQSKFTPDPNVNYFTQRTYWDNYFLSLSQYNSANGITGDIEGYSSYRRWRNYWNSCMPESGSYEEALEILQMNKDYWEHQLFDSYSTASSPPALSVPSVLWEELGPMNMTKIKTLDGTWKDTHVNNNGQNPGWDNNNGQLKSGAHVAKIDRLFQHPTSPNTIFGCAGGLENGGGGVFISEDLGQNWTLLGKINLNDIGTDQIPNPDIATFAVKPSGSAPDMGTEYYFIGLSSGAVYRSSDYGVTWIECTYYGNNSYPFYVPGQQSGYIPAQSLPYQLISQNYTNSTVEKNTDMKLTKESASANDYSRLVAVQHQGVFACDNLTAPISVSGLNINNEMKWENLTDGDNDNFDVFFDDIEIQYSDPSEIVRREVHFNDFEWAKKNGNTIYFVQFEVAEFGEVSNELVLFGNIRQYVMKSIDFGVTWELIGLLNQIDPDSPQAEEISNEDYLEANIEIIRIEPTFLYVACGGGTGGASHSLKRYNLDNSTIGWEDQYQGSINSYVGVKPHGFAIDPEDEEDWWFFTNDIQKMSGGTYTYISGNTTATYSKYHHADARDLLVLSSGELILGTDGGVYQSEIGTNDHIMNATSEGMNAAHSHHIALSQSPPFYVSSGFWHSGFQIYNPDTDEWHWGDLDDGAFGHAFFLNNDRFIRADENYNFHVIKDYNALASGSIGGPTVSSENISGRSYGIRRNTNDETLAYNNTDFTGITFLLGLGIDFEKYCAVPYSIPNEPDLVAVRYRATTNENYGWLRIYDGCSSPIPVPNVIKTVDCQAEYALLGGVGSCSFTSVLFDHRRNGVHWLVLKDSPLWQGQGKGRIAEYDPINDVYEDLSYPIDDDFNTASTQFPKWLAITDLTMDRQTGVLYLGTRNGVYYLDRAGQRWRKYSKNVPLLEASIDVRHCTGEIFASSLNRGIWHTDLIRGQQAATIEWKIEQSQIWSERMNLFCTLVIEPGVVLTVADELIVYGDQKIIVKPGGKLVVDGGTITTECGDYWTGIEVMGDYTQSQDPQIQGRLITQNGAKIEFAKEAISTWAVGNYATTGGIVHCTNTDFVNNRTSAYFYPYQDLNGNIETPNTGFFTNCKFLWDDNYIDESPEAGVILNNVNGITIKGCDFIDSRSNLAQSDNRPKGIFTLDAGYRVIARSTILTPLPLHEVFGTTGGYDVNNFVNLDYGIHALGANSVRTIIADHCKFENVLHSISISAVNNVVLTRNLVEFNASHPSDIGSSQGFGISESTGFTIEGNTFNNADATSFSGGVLTWDTGTEDNRIYKNFYNDQNLANYAYGTNSNTNPITVSNGNFQGLLWECNEGIDNRFDLASFAQVGIDDQGVKLEQGFPNLSAGNKFTDQTYSSFSAHILHTDDDQMEYFYDFGVDREPFIMNGDVIKSFSDNANECLSNFLDEIVVVAESQILSSASASQLSIDIFQLDQVIQAKQTELETNLANGDDQSLYELVENIGENNKETVQDELLGESPYLSRSLLEMIGEAPQTIFSHTWYVELIEANIEAARSEGFMNFLETKSEPLPGALFDQVEASRRLIQTERGELEMTINQSSKERKQKANLLLVNELSDPVQIDWNEVKHAIVKRNNRVSRAEVSDHFLGKGQLSECLSLLDDIDDNLVDYNLEHERLEMENFSTFKRYILSIISNAGVIEQLDSTQIQELSNMADQFTGRAAIQARNILCFHEGMCEERPIILPPNGMQLMNSEEGNEVEDLIGTNVAELKVIPNPNKGEFVLEVPEECSIAKLSIVDAQGKVVGFETMEQLENKSRITIMNKETGILFLKAECNDGSIYTTRILVKE